MAADAKAQVRAGCYHRISSDPEDKREGTARQREDTAALCEVQKWTIAGDYTDDDRSASNGKRRDRWNDLLEDIRAGKIDAIAAWDQDRNWRMMHELEDLRKFFTTLDREVKLATTGQGVIDLFSPTGVLMAQIKTAVSEHEIAMMRVRQRRAGRQRAEQGKPKWKKAFGYIPDTRDKKHDDGKRQIDTAVQQRVADAYEAVVKGDKITYIANRWNEDGVRGLNGKKWSASTMSLFLRSPRNAGLRDHNGQIVRDADGNRVNGTWDPLVDVDLWDAAQAVMNTPERLRVKSVREHLLTGVLRCGRTTKDGTPCGGSMGGQWIRQAGSKEAKRDLITYRCKACSGVTVRAENVEPLLLEALIKRLSRSDAEKLLRKKVFNPGEATQLRAEETVLRAKLNKIADDYEDEYLTREQAKRATTRVQEKLAEVTKRQLDQERLRVFEDVPLGTDKVAEKIAALSPDRHRAVLNALMTVTVMPIGSGHKVFKKERIQIVWKQDV